MGPALLPTPLSPACGPPKGCLAPGVSPSVLCPKAPVFRLCRPALAPVPELVFRLAISRKSSAHLSTSPRLDLSSGVSNVPLDTSVSPVPRRRISHPAYPMITSLRFQQSGGLPLSKEPSSIHSSSAMLQSLRRRLPLSPVSEPAGGSSWRSVSVFDVWRMREVPESGKGASVDLSTFGRNASGQEWISQRLGVSSETILLLR